MKILFIGGGNMANALIGGLIEQGFATRDIEVAEISAQARARLSELHGVRTVPSVHEADPAHDVVILAVKPPQMATVCRALGDKFRDALVVSIAAGIRTADLSRWLGGRDRLVRAMPNTPALLRAGISGLYASPAVDAKDRREAQRILGAVGSVLWFEQERMLDAVTAVSGSGPAYVFYFIEALEQAALALGIEAAAARKLAIETFLGAARLAARGEDPPAVLREKVTSRGGTTERALKVLEASAVKDRIIEAVRAAEQRARELGEEFGRL
jgi:pyrroline-5-carboxylate reductase